MIQPTTSSRPERAEMVFTEWEGPQAPGKNGEGVRRGEVGRRGSIATAGPDERTPVGSWRQTQAVALFVAGTINGARGAAVARGEHRRAEIVDKKKRSPAGSLQGDFTAGPSFCRAARCGLGLPAGSWGQPFWLAGVVPSGPDAQIGRPTASPPDKELLPCRRPRPRRI
jgi:hypothetical protein